MSKGFNNAGIANGMDKGSNMVNRVRSSTSFYRISWTGIFLIGLLCGPQMVSAATTETGRLLPSDRLAGQDFGCWNRIMLPEGSRNAQSRTP